MHPSVFGLSREQWTDHKELELAGITKPTSAAVVSPPGVREECVAELQIDLGSTSSQSGSVSPMSVPVVVRDSGTDLEQALPQLQRDLEKDGDMVFLEASRLKSPHFMEPLYVTESAALHVGDSNDDLLQPKKLATSKAEARLKDDAFGPQTSVPLEDGVTECAVLSFSDDEGDKEDKARDPEQDSDTDIDLEHEGSVEEEEATNDHPPPSSLPLNLEDRLSPLGQHFLIDHPTEAEEVDFAAPCNRGKVCASVAEVGRASCSPVM